jgi:predicted phosphodiesterase
MRKKHQYFAILMGLVVFSDVHADSVAIRRLATCIRTSLFQKTFGKVDGLVNLGDLVHRGDRPKETLEMVQALKQEYQLVSVLGNHDHAFLNGLLVSGSDPASTYRHEQIRNSPLLSIFDDMPMEWSDNGMLFVHGGPLDLGNQTLRLKCWQRLSYDYGDSFTGYHYTAPMAFDALTSRGLSHMCCGHQHRNICCRKTMEGIVQTPLVFEPLPKSPAEKKSEEKMSIEFAKIPLDVPSLLRVGGCHGDKPEFGYTDFSTFSFIRIVSGD